MTKADQIVTLLTQIRDALIGAPPAIMEELDCPHPEEKRISLRAMGSGEHWQCGDCGYVQQSPVVKS